MGTPPPVAPNDEPVWVESADGARLASYDLGGSGTPLLLAHATGFHAHVWLPVVAALADRFHCYAFDERGHGASPTPPGHDFSWDRFGDDALAVAAAFGLERPVVAGHSAGGALLLLAEQHRPGSWSKVWAFEPVVFDPATRPPGGAGADEENPLATGARRRRADFPSFEAAYDNYAAKPPFGSFDSAALEAYVRYGFVQGEGSVTLACRPEDEAETYQQARVQTAWDGLAQVSIPVRVACGALSTHFPPEQMARVAERLPGGSLEVMDHLGHFGPLEDPAAVAASITAALS